MGKVYEALQKQLDTTDKIDAENSIIIYDKIRELCDGKVNERQWVTLTDCKCVGNYPNFRYVYKPSKIGVIFLKGIFN